MQLMLVHFCCSGGLPQEELRRAVTGVAISDTDDTLSIYFGCYADLPSIGGVGLIRVSRHGLDYQLYPVLTSGSPIYGGHLFIVPDIDSGCKQFTVTSSASPVASDEVIPTNTVMPPDDETNRAPNLFNNVVAVILMASLSSILGLVSYM